MASQSVTSDKCAGPFAGCSALAPAGSSLRSPGAAGQPPSPLIASQTQRQHCASILLEALRTGQSRWARDAWRWPAPHGDACVRATRQGEISQRGHISVAANPDSRPVVRGPRLEPTQHFRSTRCWSARPVLRRRDASPTVRLGLGTRSHV